MVKHIKTTFLEKAQMLTLGLAYLEAYQALYPGLGVWENIRPLWAAKNYAGMPAVLREAIKKKEPMVIYTNPADHDHYKIIWGDELVHIDCERLSIFSPEYWWRWLVLKDVNVVRCPETHHCLRRSNAGEL